MDMTNKTAVVTGAASGMGLLFSRQFAAAGGNVLMTDVNEKTLLEQADEISRSCPGRVIAQPCDITAYPQVVQACEKAVACFGRIDVLVHFAGGAELRVKGIEHTELPDVPIDVYDWSIDVNYRGVLYFDHAVLKQMRSQQSGVIIHIGSVTGEEGSSSNIGYASAKSAVMYGLTKSIALYGAEYGIRCCCVSPGPVLTRPQMAQMKTLLGRAVQPQEIIDAVMYLISDHGAAMTGDNIFIDCGRHIMKNKSHEAGGRK